MKLSNIRSLGRYRNKTTQQEINVKKSYNKQRGTDHIFYLYRNKRIFINDADFYSANYEKI